MRRVQLQLLPVLRRQPPVEGEQQRLLRSDRLQHQFLSLLRRLRRLEGDEQRVLRHEGLQHRILHVLQREGRVEGEQQRVREIIYCVHFATLIVGHAPGIASFFRIIVAGLFLNRGLSGTQHKSGPHSKCRIKIMYYCVNVAMYVRISSIH